MTPSVFVPPAFTVAGFVALEVGAYLGLCVQIIQVAMIVSMCPRDRRLLPVVAGVCAIVHLIIAAAMLTNLDWQNSPFLGAAVQAEGMLPALWINAILAVVIAVPSCRTHDCLLWVMAVLMLASMAPVVGASGAWFNLLAVLDICGFLIVGIRQLHRVLKRRHAEPTQASVAEATNVISVGMLVTDGRGGSVFMNDAMRSQLERLGFPTDLGDLSYIWEGIQAHLVTLDNLGVKSDVFPSLAIGADPNQALVSLGDGRILLMLIERIERSNDGRRSVRVFSVDVTQLIEAARRLSSANDALEQANAELRDRLADVRAIARQAAFLRMRAAVHDVIGQRLSILQRYLDAGKVDETSIVQLRALMDSILQDLRTPSTGSASTPVEHLEDVTDAFALVDMTILVEGELPADQAVSNVLVRIIREASTNACQHAQARCVWVVLGHEIRDGRQWATIMIHNDGKPFESDGEADKADGSAHNELIREGTGIPGMRRAVEGLGGIFTVRAHPTFTIEAQIPLG